MAKVCIGMFRPLYEDLRNKLEMKDWRFFECRCLNPEISGLPFNELIDHWLLGHFDEPVYKEIDHD